MTALAPRPAPRAPRPQAVLAPLSESAVFLTMTVAPGEEDAVRDLLEASGGSRARWASACPTSSSASYRHRIRPVGPHARRHAAP